MHDNIIISYEVDLNAETLKLHTYNNKKLSNETLKAYGVLAHSFENILKNSVIFSVDEFPLEIFFKDNLVEIKKGEDYCWPTCYEEINELKCFLVDNKYKYIRIDSSYGLCGWILAQAFTIG